MAQAGKLDFGEARKSRIASVNLALGRVAMRFRLVAPSNGLNTQQEDCLVPIVSLLLLLALSQVGFASPPLSQVSSYDLPNPQRLRVAQFGWTAPTAPEDFRAKIAAGQITTAWASWWGYNKVDATEALQSAIQSQVPTLVIDNPGDAWIVRPIFLVSNQTIKFAPGVVVEAKRGEYKGTKDALFSIIRQQQVTLLGNGTTLRMHSADYADPKQYSRREWRHALSIRSSANVLVDGLTLAESGGDGIYLGVWGDSGPNRNITIRNTVCDNNYRQGISVISVNNLLIEDTVMRKTEGTYPASGIDFEPNYPEQELVGCIVRRCRAVNNQGVGFKFALSRLSAGSTPVSVLIEDCTSIDNASDLVVTTGDTSATTVTGNIEVVRGRFERAREAAVSIRGKPADGLALRFEDLVVSQPAPDLPEVIPIQVLSRTREGRSVGGIDFGTITLEDGLDRPFLKYSDYWAGGAGLETLTGTFRILRDGQTLVQPLTLDWLNATFVTHPFPYIEKLDLGNDLLVPLVARPLDWRPERAALPYLRGAVTLMFDAKKGETVRVSLNHQQVGKKDGSSLEVKVLTPSGTLDTVGSIPFKSVGTLSFTASEAGLYRLIFSSGYHRVAIASSSHPLALLGTDAPIHFIRESANLYFLVPPGLDQFGVRVFGSGGEGVQAAVLAPDGTEVWHRSSITQAQMFVGNSRSASNVQVWRLRLGPSPDTPFEDYYADLRGLPPFFASDPVGLIRVIDQ